MLVSSVIIALHARWPAKQRSYSGPLVREPAWLTSLDI